MRFPLYARILMWFLLNVAVLGGVLLVLARGELGSEWLLLRHAEPRFESVSRLLMDELPKHPRSEWTEILQRYSEAHDMEFILMTEQGTQTAGRPADVPEEVKDRLRSRPGRVARVPAAPAPPAPPAPPVPPAAPVPPIPRPDLSIPPIPVPPFDADQLPGRPLPRGRRMPLEPAPLPDRVGGEDPPRRPPERAGGRPGPGGSTMRPGTMASYPKSLVTAKDGYWVLIHLPLRDPERGGRLSLVLMSPHWSGLLLDVTPWLWGIAGAVVLSALWWLPLVRGITRTVSRMRHATAQIAEGNFRVPVGVRRQDELGDLGQSIGQLAARLEGFVHGQRRFLGDIAHELNSPLARMQMAAAVLEGRAPADLQDRVRDLTEEVEAMSQLVNELLSLSRASLAPQTVACEDVALGPLVQSVLERLGVPPARVTVDIPGELRARANPALLSRAVSNVVRNSLRYAGDGARLSVQAMPIEGDSIRLTLGDDGPGVPPESLPNLFDPFFRLEFARDRETGGTGLGLAIVKTCLESCGGSVTARNRRPHGLEVEMTLAGNTT